ncbi:MAG: thrombospondin type 3 repeat-containing protein [Planctomycetota bacterium]
MADRRPTLHNSPRFASPAKPLGLVFTLVTSLLAAASVEAQSTQRATKTGVQVVGGSQSSSSGGGTGNGGQGAGNYFGSPYLDSDRDGLHDALEISLGTDPAHRDTDRDLTSDTYEFLHTTESPLALRSSESPTPGWRNVRLAASQLENDLILTLMIGVPTSAPIPAYVVYGLIDSVPVDLTSLFAARIASGNFTRLNSVSNLTFYIISVAFPTELIQEGENISFGTAAKLGENLARANALRVYRARGNLMCAWHGNLNATQFSRPLVPPEESESSSASDQHWTSDLSCQRAFKVIKDGDGSSMVVTYLCEYASCEVFEGSYCEPDECGAAEGTLVTMISLSFLISLVN